VRVESDSLSEHNSIKGQRQKIVQREDDDFKDKSILKDRKRVHKREMFKHRT
jgi:hypothetical protein